MKVFQIISNADAPLVATAIHDGHKVRSDLYPLLALSPEERLREEDPFTAEWTELGYHQVIGLYSRFQVDLNRPVEQAVYLEPDDSWGLSVWDQKPSPEQLRRALAEREAFYTEMHRLLDGLRQRFGYFIVYDIHSYNHRRDGPESDPAHPEKNPDLNVGTGSLDRNRWGGLVDCFINQVQTAPYPGRRLDVRENVRFQGGEFPRWIHRTFPQDGCALALEFKKFFMDEWTGVPDPQQVGAIREVLLQTVEPVLAALAKIGKSSRG